MALAVSSRADDVYLCALQDQTWGADTLTVCASLPFEPEPAPRG